MPSPSAETKCPGCGAAAEALIECPYCGTVVPTFEKAVGGVRDVRITAPGQRVVVLYLKAQHERAKGHMGAGCVVVLLAGFGLPALFWYLGSPVGALAALVVGVGGGIALGIREERLLCEREILPGLRQRMSEEGVDRAETLRLAGETLPASSTLLQSILGRL